MMSTWTHAVEDVLQSAKEQRGKVTQHWHTRSDLVRNAGLLLLAVQEMDELGRQPLNAFAQGNTPRPAPVAKPLNVEPAEVEESGEAQHGARNLPDEKPVALGALGDDLASFEDRGAVAATHGEDAHTKEIA